MAEIIFIPFGGSAAGGTDHFAPKYLVGNVPAGDDPGAYNAGGFQYIPDPGDGSGIAAALLQLNGPGDVWIRPGTYVLASTLVVPTGVRVQGAGPTTTISGSATAQVAFDLGQNSQLRDLRVVVGPAAVALGASAVVCRGRDGRLDNVEVAITADAGGQLRNGVEFVGGGVPSFRLWYATRLRVTALNSLGIADPVRCVVVSGPVAAGADITTSGGDIAVDVTAGAFTCSTFLFTNWSAIGARVSGDSLRLVDGHLRSAAGAVNPVGVAILGGNVHQLRGIGVEAQSQPGSLAVQFAAGGDGSLFSACTFAGWENGFVAASGSGVAVLGCSAQVSNRAVELLAGADRWKVSACDFVVSAATGPSVSMSAGTGHVLADTRIQHIGFGFVGAVLLVSCVRARVHDLDLSVDDIAACIVLVSSSFCTVHGNSVFSTFGTFGVDIQPGSENNSVIGNVVQGTIIPVTDNGTDTEVAHNTGAI